MSWIEEKDNRIFNEDTITKPWYAEQFIKLLDYLIVNGVEEFARFSKEADNLSISEKNCLRMIQVFSYQAMGPIKEKWKELLEKYPHIKKFLKDNDMIDKRELCSGLYYYNLFKNLSENPNLAKIFKERLEKIKCLNANICWYPFKNSPFAIDGNGLFPWVSLATYDITDEDEKLDILIPFGLPDSDGFKVNNGIIVVPKSWNLSVLPDEIQKILFDSDLFIDFFIELENKKIGRLKSAKGKSKKFVYPNK